MKIPLILDLDGRPISDFGENVKIGFVWDVEHWRKGRLLQKELTHNIMCTEGLNYFLDTSVRGGAALSTWYIAIFEGNYTPILGDTAATIVASATECTAYSESVRQTYTTVAAASGVLTNAASVAVFTANTTKTIYGGFITSASAKSATTGKLISAAKFATSKAVESTDVLNITATITLTSS